MIIEYPLTKANRIRLAQAFRLNPRVDLTFDCVIENQMGKAYVDHLEHPSAFKIAIEPFWYFAGEAQSPGGREMIQSLPPYTLFMPSPPEWVALAKETFGERLLPFDRYSFSPAQLSFDHLESLWQSFPDKTAIRRIDIALAERIRRDPDSMVPLTDFDSAEDFFERSIGFCMMKDGAMVGAACGSLACSRGIEVSIFVADEYRRQGVATALACRLLQYCLEHRMEPHWDAANPESCKLAEKLGYVYTGSYEAYYLRREQTPG